MKWPDPFEYCYEIFLYVHISVPASISSVTRTVLWAPVLPVYSPPSCQADGRERLCQGKCWLKAWLNKAWLQHWGVARGGIHPCSGHPSEKQAGVHAIPYRTALHRQTGKKKRKNGFRKKMRRVKLQKPVPHHVVAVVQKWGGNTVAATCWGWRQRTVKFSSYIRHFHVTSYSVKASNCII